ncbi:MAG TPA: FISUMP domain-containing protein [Bacteroidales bacterium]|nr:FISUMP domain-containing protein [Bacteroidales bacterium]
MKTKMALVILPAMIGLSLIACVIRRSSEVKVRAVETGTFEDPRDGRIYKTIKIGNQWLMSENFTFKPPEGNYWAYDNDQANVAKYGYLYDWETARRIAPKGWHLPTESDWKTLRASLGGKREIVKILGGTMEIVYKQMAPGGCGFNALMAGIRTGGGRFILLGERTDFWSSSPSRDGQYFYILDAKTEGKPRGLLDSKEGTAALAKQQDHATWGKSVRLFKD